MQFKLSCRQFIQGPVTSMSRCLVHSTAAQNTRRTPNFHETLVQWQIVSDGILPGFTIVEIIELTVMFHDIVVDLL